MKKELREAVKEAGPTVSAHVTGGTFQATDNEGRLVMRAQVRNAEALVQPGNPSGGPVTLTQAKWTLYKDGQPSVWLNAPVATWKGGLLTASQGARCGSIDGKLVLQGRVATWTAKSNLLTVNTAGCELRDPGRPELRAAGPLATWQNGLLVLPSGAAALAVDHSASMRAARIRWQEHTHSLEATGRVRMSQGRLSGSGEHLTGDTTLRRFHLTGGRPRVIVYNQPAPLVVTPSEVLGPVGAQAIRNVSALRQVTRAASGGGYLSASQCLYLAQRRGLGGAFSTTWRHSSRPFGAWARVGRVSAGMNAWANLGRSLRDAGGNSLPDGPLSRPSAKSWCLSSQRDRAILAQQLQCWGPCGEHPLVPEGRLKSVSVLPDKPLGRSLSMSRYPLIHSLAFPGAVALAAFAFPAAPAAARQHVELGAMKVIIDADQFSGDTITSLHAWGKVVLTGTQGVLRADQVDVALVGPGKGAAGAHASPVHEAHATGHVQVSSQPKPDERMEATGAAGTYWPGTQKATLTGGVTVTMTSPQIEGPAVMTGSHADIDLAKRSAEVYRTETAPVSVRLHPKGGAAGATTASQGPLQLLADRVLLDNAANRVTATGSPVLEGDQGTVHAERIWFDIDPAAKDVKTVHAVGQVRIDSQDPQRGTFHGTSQEAVVNRDSNTAVLTGDVHGTVTHPDHPEPDKLQGDRLTYNFKTHTFQLGSQSEAQATVSFTPKPKSPNESTRRHGDTERTKE